MRRHELGLHTKEEQAGAREQAIDVYEAAKGKILRDGDRDSLLFALGYLAAVGDLADLEGVRSLGQEMRKLADELQKAYPGEL